MRQSELIRRVLLDHLEESGMRIGEPEQVAA